jgi:uncharacterized membrane protein YecN with MAPEG domain
MIPSSLIDITAQFAAILGVLHVVFTLRVGLYRKNSKISFGDGGDKALLQRVRAHGNFIENAPIALILILLNELQGLSDAYLYGLGGLFLISRLSHYGALAFSLPLIFRALGMLGTLVAILALAVSLFVNA